jgi:hypothetical protein
MKLTVKLPDGCPISAKCDRRTLGVFRLVERVSELGSTHELSETAVPIDAENAIVVQAHYVSANDSFCIIARFRSPTEDIHVLAAAAECHCTPVSLVCRLPTRQFVEVYLQHEIDDGCQCAAPNPGSGIAERP